MRTPTCLLFSAALLAAALAAPARSGTITVDPFVQSVETTRFRMSFDFDRPELMRNLYFKDWSTTRDVAGENSDGLEFWGQAFRGVNAPGLVRNDRIEEHTWELLGTTDTTATVRIWDACTDEPEVTTTYTFVADRPWFVVERTVHFSGHPDTAACQIYVPRVSFVNTYRALRWRDVDRRYLQRGYCVGGCATPGWDGRWLEHVNFTNASGFSVAQIYRDDLPAGTMLARGSGLESFSGWVSPLTPSGLKDTDLTIRLMVAFSTTPGDTAALDSLWAYFNARPTTDVPPTAGRPSLVLRASPNPAAGPVRFAWALGARARVRLEVLDTAGRRVATPLDGEREAGAHALAWDGRGDDGRRLPPGIYLARLATPTAVATARIARVH